MRDSIFDEPAIVRTSSLQPGNGATSHALLAEMLQAVRFDITKPPPHAPPIFKLGNAKISTAGNLGAIQAQSKAGKSAFTGAMLAATMEPKGDCLGIWSENPTALSVVHFDTEQSRADHHECIRRVLRRAGRENPPPCFRSYCLTGMTLKDRNAAMRFELERAAAECGGIHSVFLDGVADLAADPNDPVEAFALIDEFHRLAIKFSTTIWCILHENPGSEHGKTRGHLGSQLERKAETNLRLAKGGDGITVVYAERARHAYIPRNQGSRFHWCDKTGMHISTGTIAQANFDQKMADLLDLARKIFCGVQSGHGLSWTDVVKKVEEICQITNSGARKKFVKLVEAHVIQKRGDNYFFV